jgi:hypothetical protein
MAAARLEKAPEGWTPALGAAMAAGDADLQRAAVRAARALPVPKEGPAEIHPAL